MTQRKNILLVALALAVAALAGALFLCCVLPRMLGGKVPPEYGGYRGYVSKPPFYVLVSKQYPATNSALFVNENSPVVFSTDQLKEDKTRASMSVGQSFSAHVLMKSPNEPSQFSIMVRLPDHQEQIMQDFDINGTWDAKTLMPDNKRFIFIGTAWLEVEKISGAGSDSVNATVQGQTYRFDRAKGIWQTDSGQSGNNAP
jgi:hypothetical protein